MIFNIVYALFLIIASPYYLWSICTKDKHRKGLSQKFGFSKPDIPSGDKIWIHAVSVGEVLICREFIREIQLRKPNYTIVLSVTTATGYAIAKKTFPHITTIFFPYDFSWVVKKVISRVNPKAILLVELELWPNFIKAANKCNIPITVINGRLSANSLKGFKRFHPIVKNMLNGINLYLMQNAQYEDHVKQLGVATEKIINAGNIKYDALSFETQDNKIKSVINVINPDIPVLVAGSTHHPEDVYLLNACKEKILNKQLQLILVPRHPERYNSVEEAISTAGLNCLRKTALDNNLNPKDDFVVMIDTIGELSQIYGISSLVYIGGSLNGHGGQNLMEPAALGKPIICGPAMHNFTESYNLLKKAGVVFTVNDESELKKQINVLLENNDFETLGKNAAQCLKAQQGATQKHLDCLIENHII